MVALCGVQPRTTYTRKKVVHTTMKEPVLVLIFCVILYLCSIKAILWIGDMFDEAIRLFDFNKVEKRDMKEKKEVKEYIVIFSHNIGDYPARRAASKNFPILYEIVDKFRGRVIARTSTFKRAAAIQADYNRRAKDGVAYIRLGKDHEEFTMRSNKFKETRIVEVPKNDKPF